MFKFYFKLKLTQSFLFFSLSCCLLTEKPTKYYYCTKIVCRSEICKLRNIYHQINHHLLLLLLPLLLLLLPSFKLYSCYCYCPFSSYKSCHCVTTRSCRMSKTSSINYSQKYHRSNINLLWINILLTYVDTTIDNSSVGMEWLYLIWR